jgi:hypothetical protein
MGYRSLSDKDLTTSTDIRRRAEEALRTERCVMDNALEQARRGNALAAAVKEYQAAKVVVDLGSDSRSSNYIVHMMNCFVKVEEALAAYEGKK